MAKIQEITSLIVNPDPSNPENFMLDLGYLDQAGAEHRIELQPSDGLFLWNLLGLALANYRDASNTPAILHRLKAVYSKHPVYHPDKIHFPTP